MPGIKTVLIATAATLMPLATILYAHPSVQPHNHSYELTVTAPNPGPNSCDELHFPDPCKTQYDHMVLERGAYHSARVNYNAAMDNYKSCVADREEQDGDGAKIVPSS
jgi:hypothetical protein